MSVYMCLQIVDFGTTSMLGFMPVKYDCYEKKELLR